MKDFLPLFPLQLVVFPGEQLNLHVFEPRYKQLLRECEANGITFGVPAFVNNTLMDYGTEVEVIEVVKRYAGGELDVKTRGLGKFKILEYFKVAPNKLYSGADIERIKDDDLGDISLNPQIIEAVDELFELLKVTKSFNHQPEHFQTYEIAHHIGLTLEQEFEFFCIHNELDRQLFVQDHLNALIPIVKEMEALKEKVRMNGHFKNIIPPKV